MVGNPTYKELEKKIKELKNIEKQLTESEERYRSILETINDGVILQAASGEILTWNKGAENIFGISSKDTIGQKSEEKDWSTIHEDGSKYHAKDHPSMITLRTGRPCNNEIMGVWQPSGKLRWISINTKPLLSENSDKPYAVAISFSDITEMKKKAIELIQIAETLREAQKYAKIGSWWYDPETQTPTWTDEMFYIFGLEPQPEALPYEEHRKIIHPDDWGLFETAVTRAVTEGIGYNLELKIVRPSGEIRYINAKCDAERDDRGDVKRLIGTTQDITEKKKVEHEKDRLISDLQKNMQKVKQLSGLLPICAHCKKIRNDKGYWTQIESYIYEHSEIEFSHSICQECAKKYYPDMDIYEE